MIYSTIPSKISCYQHTMLKTFRFQHPFRIGGAFDLNEHFKDPVHQTKKTLPSAGSIHQRRPRIQRSSSQDPAAQARHIRWLDGFQQKILCSLLQTPTTKIFNKKIKYKYLFTVDGQPRPWRLWKISMSTC